MVEMTVQRVGIDPRRNAVLILADADGHRLLPIYIGFYEAQSIAMAISGEDIGRPLTHDLMLSVIEAMGGELSEVHVTRLVDRTFFAMIQISVEGRGVAIDARPSDAIALAVRTGVRILVAEEVLAQMQVIDDSSGEDTVDQERFRDLLGQINFDDDVGEPE